jgi:hypothetical protein
MSGITATITYGPFIASEAVASISVDLFDPAGVNTPMVQSVPPDTSSVVFADVPAGTWQATFQALGVTGTLIGAPFTTAPIDVPSIMNVNIPVGGALALS